MNQHEIEISRLANDMIWLDMAQYLNVDFLLVARFYADLDNAIFNCK